MKGLIERVEQMREKSKTMPKKTPPKPAPVEAKKLPTWPDVVRAVPNGVLRSALFGAIRKGKRPYLKNERIAALDGIEIRCTGERLDQGDLDVWESVLHVSRAQGLGSQCRVTAYALLRLMGKTDTGKNRQILHERITRLRANAIELKQGPYSYIGGLIQNAARDETTHEWLIELDAKLRPLFAADQFTQVDWYVRHALDGQPTAQWLHGFYSSHAKPYPMRAETLLELSGSENSTPTSARQKLRKALDALSKASELHGQFFRYELKDGLIHVEKTPTPTQRRHIRKKPSA